MSIPCSKSKPDNPLSPQTSETFIGKDRTLDSRETTRKSGQRFKQKICDQERMTITPIAHIHTPFSEKFGIPRQSCLVDIPATIVFTPPFRRVEAVRGLETFSHVWLIWQFSKTPHTQKNLTVRPPRLGGNRRLGVFATRSPFRPNHLGLSCVRLVRVEFNSKWGPVLHVRGADLLDQTPIYDLKPYLPFTDAHADAVGGFADDVYEHTLEVYFPPSLENTLPNDLIEQIRSVLEQDIRPSYQTDPTRLYGMCYDKYQIRFTVDGNKVFVRAVRIDHSAH